MTSALDSYPADGKSTGSIILENSLFNHDSIVLPGPSCGVLTIITHEKNGDTEKVRFRSTTRSGSAEFRTIKGKAIVISFYAMATDLDRDGFPDQSELDSSADRRAFVDWFVRTAESQFLKKNYSWSRKDRDCAGLIRYAYREALKKHDQKWLRKSGITLDKNLPDVNKFNYPDVPIIGDRIFKVRPGSADDIGSFSAYTDAAALINYNTTFISRKTSDAQRGDILFFRDDENVKYPYHSMIVAENSYGNFTLIYHTGSENDEIKRVPLSYLAKSALFKPVEWNKNFLGIYRFSILE